MPLFDTSGLNGQKVPSNLLKDKYLVPPFSIINTITQYWQKRKDLWESMGLKSAQGRDTKRHNATPSNTFSSRGKDAKEPESISTFDPALCELMYEWFSRPGDRVLDPFAGGVVRGAVAASLGRLYNGIDLSARQVEENEQQYNAMANKYKLSGRASWRVGDAEEILNSSYIYSNFIFTCPPYYDLEKYSDNPNDLSNLATYEDFRRKYRKIIRLACDTLEENSFAVIVVSEIRSKTGEYYGFVPDTIYAFADAGLYYYNEIILENNIGSLPIRAPKYFDQSRKIGRQHQNILVFYKGTPDISHIHSKFGNFSND